MKKAAVGAGLLLLALGCCATLAGDARQWGWLMWPAVLSGGAGIWLLRGVRIGGRKDDEPGS